MTPLATAAHAAVLLAERHEDDPLWTYQPWAKQRAFLASDADECWYTGANRIAKSDTIAYWTAAMARYGRADARSSYAAGGRIQLTDRAVSLWAVSLTNEMSRDILQPKLFDNGYCPPGQHAPFIPAYEQSHWSQTSQVLKLKNGSLIGFKSADQGRERFQGTGKDGVVFDEVPPYGIYQECAIRVEGGRRLLIRGACTILPPEGIAGGVSWLYAQKIRPWLEGIGRDRVQIITASLYDFHAERPDLIPKSELDRLESIYPAGSIDRRIRMNGELIAEVAGARAYQAFDRRVHVNPKLTRESVDFRRPLLLGFDSNVEPMGSVVWQSHMVDGRARYRQIDELTLETGSVPDLAQEFRRRYPVHGAELQVYGDATSRFRKAQTAQSDYDLLMAELGQLPYPVRLCVPDRNPPVKDRLNALNSLLRGLGGVLRLEIAPHCTETIADFEECRLNKDGSLAKAKNSRDPYYRRTAWTDGAGYIAAFLEPVSVQAAVLQSGGRTLKLPRPRYFVRR